MRRWVTVAAALSAFALGAAAAFAKAPKAADTPSVEDIYQQAMAAIADKAKADANRNRDPEREAIELYRERKTELSDYQRLVDILNNAKDEKIQGYRMDAANALVSRFQREEENDPKVRSIRRDIAGKVLELMKAPQKDEIGLRAIETILFSWWRAKMQIEIKFKATDKLEERKKAYTRMNKFLAKGSD